MAAPLLIIPVPAAECFQRWLLADVGGLPLLRRIVLTARAQGLDAIVVISDTKAAAWRHCLQATTARMVTAADMAAVSGKLLLLNPLFLPAPGFLAEAAAAPLATAFAMDGVRVAILLAAADALAALQVGDDGWERALSRAERQARGWLINSEAARQAAENGLLRRLPKASDGLLARLINRRLSLAVTRRLMRTSITPNQMTAVSTAIGLLAAALFLLPLDAAGIAAASLFLLHSMLDGCDGELARLKFMQSRLGGILDFWSDNIVHMAVFLCLGSGVARTLGNPGFMLLGGIAAAATLLAAAIIQRHAMAAGGYVSVSSRTEKTSLVRIADALSRRDFIYLVLLLAIVDRLDVFLWLAAIGTPLYVLALAAISLKDRCHA